MSDALTIAANGLNLSSARIAKTASNIVNASSTGGGGGLAANIVNLVQEKTAYESDVAVIKVAQKNQQALIDILA